MTKPLPPDAERKRPQAACLACRTKRQRCQGSPLAATYGAVTPAIQVLSVEELKCTRCRDKRLDCVFVESRRKGRPRRLGDKPRKGAQNEGSPIDYDSELPEEPPMGLPPPVVYHAGPSRGESSTTRRSIGSTPPELRPCPSGTVVVSLQQLVDAYYAQVDHYLPLFPFHDPERLNQYLLQAPPHLLDAIRTVALPNSCPIPAFQQNLPVDPSVHDIQTAILLVYTLYGSDRVPEASSLMDWLSRMLLEMRWDKIDAGPDSSPSIRMTSLSDSDSPSSLGSASDSPASIRRSDEELDLVRACWREAWIVEAMLAVLTGQLATPPRMHSLEARVGLADYGVFDMNDSRVLSLRIESARLLVHCASAFSPLQYASQEARIRHLTAMAGELERATRDHSIRLRASRAKTTSQERALARLNESIMMTLNMTCNAMIYLHTTSAGSAAFICGIDFTKEVNTLSGSGVFTAARSIFQFSRERTPGLSRAPFCSCAPLSGSHALCMTLSLLNETPSPTDIKKQNEWIVSSIVEDLRHAVNTVTEDANHWKSSQNILAEISVLRDMVLLDPSGFRMPQVLRK